MLTHNYSTSYITAVLECTMKAVSINFCKNSPDKFCQDSCYKLEICVTAKTFWLKPLNWKAKTNIIHSSRCESSLCRLVHRHCDHRSWIECPKHTIFNTKACKIIVELNKFYINVSCHCNWWSSLFHWHEKWGRTLPQIHWQRNLGNCSRNV